MTADLAAFVLARLDEEAETARAAVEECGSGDAWVNAPSCIVFTPQRDDEGTWDGCISTTRHRAAHIALQDPQATLDRIDATRLIVAMHRQMGPTPSWRRVWCLRCSTDEAEIKWPCPTMRALAWTWHRHPSWRQSWAPDGVRADAPR